MRNINVKQVEAAVARLCAQANLELSADVLSALKRSLKLERSVLGRQTLKPLIENADIARRECIPICQDTGTAVLFINIGQEVRLSGGDLNEAVQRGVRQGYRWLRKSIVADPLTRKNTGDNTPAIIHYAIVPGRKVKITFSPKGAGSENKSRLVMLRPADGIPEIKKFVLETVKLAGASACPPLIVGVGIGGNFETAPLLAKKALLRNIGSPNKDRAAARIEKDLVREINKTGIGPSGFGGKTTALAVHIEQAPCHIASLPVAVNIGCHANRHKEITL